MHFRVSDWCDQFPQDAELPPCPWRVLDPATGNLISAVTEFNDDEGWLRVLCRSPQRYDGQTDFAYAANGTDDLVSQIVTMPYQVVPYYDGIDEIPQIYVDTVEYNGGDPIGPWIPQTQPYQHKP